MLKYRDLDPLDPLPASWTDAWQSFLSTAAVNFLLRIKPTDLTVLEVPAGADNDAACITIDGNPRWIEATIERASPGGGSPRDLDVWATGTANSFTPGTPGEVDSTDYAFALAITEVGDTPTADISRRIAVAHWTGTLFDALTVLVGGAAERGQKWRPGDLKASLRQTPEPGWIAADGSGVTTDYPALRAQLLADGSPWGVDGSGNPRVIDLRGRALVGVDGAAGRLTANDTLGAGGGAEKHTLSTAEIPSHDHGEVVQFGGSTQPTVQGPAASQLSTTYGTDQRTQATGGGGPHNNMPPYAIGCWYVKT